MNHEPLCNWEWFYHPGGRSIRRCTCDLIRAVRADVAETIAHALETELQTSHWYKWVDDDGDEYSYGSIVIHGDDQIRSDAAAIARRIGHG